MDKGLNARQIAEGFTNGGRSITAEAIRQRINRMRDEDEERANFLLPWRVRQEHSQGTVYKAIVAHAKHQKGLGVTPYELDLERQLLEKLQPRNAVIGYDRDSGFVVRNRRPGDGTSALVA